MAERNTLGKYEIISVLGKGAMGVVYKGRDPFMERIVALKTLRNELLDEQSTKDNLLSRFMGEARAYGRLMHPNIVTCYSYEEQDDCRFIVLEYVDGKPLRELLDEGRRFTVEEALDMARQILEALRYSHQHGVIHRDIKPANILVTGDGRIKVTDFGIARIDTSTLTQTGYVMGSPSYMSPEQVAGDRVDERSDLFSAGIVFYELLTGINPFRGDDLVSTINKILHYQPASLREINPAVSAALDQVILKALVKHPEERIQTAAEFVALLDQAARAEVRNAATSAEDDRHIDIDATVLQEEPGAAVIGEDALDYAIPGMIGDGRTPQGTAVRTRSKKAGAGPGVAARSLWVGGGVISMGVLLGGLWWFFFRGAPTAVEPVTSGLPFPSQTVSTGSPDGAGVVEPSVTEGIDTVALARAVEGFDCASITPTVTHGNTVVLDGFVQNRADARRLVDAVGRLSKVKDVVVNLEVYEWPFCEVIELLSPYLPAVSGVHASTTLVTADNQFQLREGQNLELQMSLPQFAGRVYVEYFQLDGGVVHLLPNSVERDNAFSPGETMWIGSAERGQRTWTVAPPFGEEMIVMIAAREALFGGAVREEFEDARRYLTALRDELARRQPEDVAVDYVFIKTSGASVSAN